MRYLLLLFALLIPLQVEAATYYVNDDGSHGANCTDYQNIATPAATVDAGRACLSGGDTLYIRAGTYDAKFEQNGGDPLPSGSAGNPTTVSSYNGEVVTLAPTGGVRAFTCIARSYITINGIIFDVDAQNGSAFNDGMSLGGCNHIIISNFKILHAERNGILITFTSGSVWDATSGDNTFSNCEITDFASANGGQGHAFYVSSGPNNIVEDCELHDGWGWGIQHWNEFAVLDANIFRRNTIYNNSNIATTNEGGIVIGGSYGTGTRVENNFIYNNKTCISVGESDGAVDTLVYHNTCVDNGDNYDNGAGGGANIVIGVESVGTLVKNNIAWSASGLNYANSGTSTVCDYIVAEDTTSGCSHITTSDPLFVNAGTKDYHLQAGSPAKNAGVTGLGVTDDIDGDTRDASPDIGADEFPVFETIIYVDGSLGGDCVGGYNPTTRVCNSGGADIADTTIAGGIARLTANQGNILDIRAGTYAERIDSNNQVLAGGTNWTNATIYRGHDGETVQTDRMVLAFPSSQAQTTLSYATFQNLKLVNTSINDDTVAISGALSFARFYQLEVSDSVCAHSGFNAQTNTSAAPNNLEIVGGRIHHNGKSGAACSVCFAAQTCTSGTLGHGMYFAANTSIVDDVELDNNGAYGAQNYNASYASPTGDPEKDTRPSNNIWRNLKIHDNRLGSANGGGLALGQGVDLQFYNNVVYAVPDCLIVGYNAPDNALVYNNSFRDCDNNLVAVQDGATDTEIKNNIFDLTAGGGLSLSGAGSGTTFATNLCTTSNATWCQIVGSPDFTNAGSGDFTLTSSSDARDVGTSLAGTFTTDQIGTGRPQGSAWDVGAYEFIVVNDRLRLR